MNEDVLLDLFYVGFNHRTAPDYINTVGSIENHLVVLGRKFAKNHKTPPIFVFLDKDRILNISEDMITCFGVFALGQDLKLIDQYGQIIDILHYPSDDDVFEVRKTKIPNLALIVNSGL